MEEINPLKSLSVEEIEAEVENWEQEAETIKSNFEEKAKIMLKNAEALYNNPDIDFKRKDFIKQIKKWAPYAGYAKTQIEFLITKIYEITNYIEQ